MGWIFGTAAQTVIGVRDLVYDVATGKEDAGLISTPMHDAASLLRDAKKANPLDKAHVGKLVADGCSVIGDFKGLCPRHIGKETIQYGVDMFSGFPSTHSSRGCGEGSHHRDTKTKNCSVSSWGKSQEVPMVEGNGNGNGRSLQLNWLITVVFCIANFAIGLVVSTIWADTQRNTTDMAGVVERVLGLVGRINGIETHINAVDEAKNLNMSELARVRAELEALEKRETAWQADLYHEQSRLDNLESLLRPLDGPEEVAPCAPIKALVTSVMLAQVTPAAAEPIEINRSPLESQADVCEKGQSSVIVRCQRGTFLRL